ncbi:putative LRR receptor-like serine/threonine-protein kinase [Carex littledalei]|uniref:Putative LRR receptor-like serine/threonine-protein kinase n=1 Tax=Carex littledalei TaxID=544730 RepID=A0A833VPC0_9POAL|nr:putative LRR receptor-like serine/threonine-protein kinase [Carex littledalei]
MKSSIRFSLLFLLAFDCAFHFAPSNSLLQDDVWILIAFKRAIFEDPLSKLSDWDAMHRDPCSWYGVRCSGKRDQLISLNLSNSSLKGFLAPELGQFSSLQELHLDNNLFMGTIPNQIGLLKNLTVLDLSVNRLTGPIPAELGDLSRIRKINLHSNGLTGSIPVELGKLQNLVELRLDRNRLKGPIPGSAKTSVSQSDSRFMAHDSGNGLCQQSSHLRVADFSYNFLVGKIPACLRHLPRSSFQGNCFQDDFSVLQRTMKICNGGYVKTQPAQKGVAYKESNEWHKHQNPRQPWWLLFLEIVTGILILVLVFTGIVSAYNKSCKLKPALNLKAPWSRTQSWRDEITISIDCELLKNIPRLTRQELEIACEDFSNIIGSTNETVVYKGTLKDGPEAAVISLCISHANWSNYHEFSYESKLAHLARLNHENIAKFLGYCKESEPFTRMVVFEYASNGTLYEHLHYGEDGSHLSWIRRMKVAIGIAKGLRYLHTELQPPYALANLNSNAVYVTEDFAPKLVDFECWNMLFSNLEKNSYHIQNGSSVHGFPGTLEERNMDVQANTYAFGVVLLEIISGRPPYCKDQGCLVEWAVKHLQNAEEIKKLVDPVLTNFRTEDLEVICSAVTLCLEPDPSKRPSMQIIAGILENGIDLSVAAQLKESPLAWAELALSS